MTTLQIMVASPVQAHQVLNNLFQQQIKPHTRTGAAGVITWETSSSWLRLKHRGAFHGHILQAFSEQVWFRDERTGRPFRYSKAVWKEYLKREFLTPKLEEYTTRHGEIKVRARRLSTEELSDDEYQRFIDQVQAFGICDLGIEFPEEGYP